MRLTLQVQKLDTPERVVFDKVMIHFGSGCFLQKATDLGEEYRVPIGVHFPSSVIDEKTNTERIFTFHFTNVGEFVVKKHNLKVKSRPSLKNIKMNIFESRKQVSKKVERDLIKVIGDPNVGVKFGVLKYAHLGVQPIYRTITRLLETPEKYPSRSWVESIKYDKLVDLIVDIGYATYNEQNRLTPTNELRELYTKSDGDTIRTAESIIGLVLAKHYDYLYQTKRIIHFVPYVRASTTFYTEALQYGSLIQISEKRLIDSMHKYYRLPIHPSEKASFGYPTTIRELLDAEILVRSKENFITGRQDIFDKLKHVRDEFPMSEPAFSSRSDFNVNCQNF